MAQSSGRSARPHGERPDLLPSEGLYPADDLALERQQRYKYRTYYTPEHLDRQNRPATDYFAKLAALRLRLIHERYDRGWVLDLCCGNGNDLLPVACGAEQVIGLDFSPELLAAARQRAVVARQRNVACILGNARAIPVQNESMALVFSFASLYGIPKVDQVVQECARVLEPGGVAILEFGVLYSLNTLVCKAYPEVAVPCHLPLLTIRNMVAEAGLAIERDRAFQLLPLWGDRPRWLRPLLHPFWRRFLGREVGGRMLDELISSLWPARHFAFRHLLVCRKPRRGSP